MWGVLSSFLRIVKITAFWSEELLNHLLIITGSCRHYVSKRQIGESGLHRVWIHFYFICKKERKKKQNQRAWWNLTIQLRNEITVMLQESSFRQDKNFAQESHLKTIRIPIINKVNTHRNFRNPFLLRRCCVYLRMERQRGTRLKRKKNREFVKEKCGDGETEVEEKKKKKALSDGAYTKIY